MVWGWQSDVERTFYQCQTLQAYQDCLTSLLPEVRNGKRRFRWIDETYDGNISMANLIHTLDDILAPSLNPSLRRLAETPATGIAIAPKQLETVLCRLVALDIDTLDADSVSWLKVTFGASKTAAWMPLLQKVKRTGSLHPKVSVLVSAEAHLDPRKNSLLIGPLQGILADIRYPRPDGSLPRLESALKRIKEQCSKSSSTERRVYKALENWAADLLRSIGPTKKTRECLRRRVARLIFDILFPGLINDSLSSGSSRMPRGSRPQLLTTTEFALAGQEPTFSYELIDKIDCCETGEAPAADGETGVVSGEYFDPDEHDEVNYAQMMVTTLQKVSQIHGYINRTKIVSDDVLERTTMIGLRLSFEQILSVLKRVESVDASQHLPYLYGLRLALDDLIKAKESCDQVFSDKDSELHKLLTDPVTLLLGLRELLQQVIDKAPFAPALVELVEQMQLGIKHYNPSILDLIMLDQRLIPKERDKLLQQLMNGCGPVPEPDPYP